MAGKSGLANQLLGKMIKPNPAYGDVEDKSYTNNRIWFDWAQKTASGEYVATIQAAWVDGEGKVKVLVSDPFGHMQEMWAEHVQLFEAGR